ncbi:MAG: IS1634 family transposase [Thioploca sp.]|nr:IS1634 family transposase [Thioploca sp.]
MSKKRLINSANSKEFSKLCQHDIACEVDARNTLVKFENQLKISLINNIKVNRIPHFKGKGRPARGHQPDHYSYRIEGTLASNLQERKRRLGRKSGFILATNQLNHKLLSDQELIAAYKNQQKVECGFRFLKAPMFMASTRFLKSPQRIMALMMVMTLSLLVYAALEHRIRQTLKTHHQTFPNQTGQSITSPTARWIFQFFSGTHLLI